MAKLTLDGAEIEVADGSQLVEAIKQQGTFISNLCYIDGLPPYAGCRTGTRRFEYGDAADAGYVRRHA